MTSNHDNHSPTGFEISDLKRLIAAASDGVLQPAERDQLEKMLVVSREARSIYIAYMQLNSTLDWKIRGRQSLRRLVDCTPHNRFHIAVANGAKRAAGRMPGGSVRRITYAGGALAATLTLALAAALWTTGPSRDRVSTVADGISSTSKPGSSGGSSPSEFGAVAKIVELSTECRWFVENRGKSAGSVARAGDTIRLTQGRLKLEFTCGATVTMKSPAALEVISSMKTRAVLGTLTAHVNKRAQGFTVETPRTTVVDLGTDFGVDVTNHGSTDVVVFTGAVDLHYDDVQGLRSKKRLRAGEGVRVSGEGTASRIVSIVDSQFGMAEGAAAGGPRTTVISAVNDNIRRGESWHYYEVVQGGMREDAKAFVDRKDHEWNGVDESGIPSYLLGGDYVKTFNDDKENTAVEMRVTVDRPAVLYVLHDNRTPPPDWLRNDFFDTGDDIGMDGGGYRRIDYKTVAVGPGKSIDDTLSIWRRDVLRAGTVELGAIQIGGEKHNMYGIVAVPLELGDGRDDFAGSADHPSSQATPMTLTPASLLAVDGSIEQLRDADVFSFSWEGGGVRAECTTNGAATLDTVLRVHDVNELLVGYSRSARASGHGAGVTMNLPRGVYYATVIGGDEIGDVGAYRLEITRNAIDTVARPLAPSPSLELQAIPTATSVSLSWNKLPGAQSYVLERSTDGVEYASVTTTTGASAVDAAVNPGATYVYRLRAEARSKQSASAPLLVCTRAAGIVRANAVGRPPLATVVEWRDVAGDEGYRVERSLDGKSYEPIGDVPRNASAFEDREVEPGKRYFYRVSTLDRVGAAPASDEVSALTGVGDFSATVVGGNKVRLRWAANYSDAKVFVERAEDDDDFSTVATLNGNADRFIDASATPGARLRYRIITVEETELLSQAAARVADAIKIPKGVTGDHYALQFNGKLRIDRPGRYTFYLNSDDGSRLFLDGSIVIDNDGQHPAEERWGSVDLVPGDHDLEVQYFECEGDVALDLSWSGPDSAVQEVPASALSSLTYRRVNGSWSRLPFTTIRAVSPNVTVNMPKRSIDSSN